MPTIPLRHVRRLALAALGTSALAAGYEGAATFKASAILPASWLKGPHHKVAEEVRTDGYFQTFTITSDYGTIPAEGRSMLSIRLREVAALAQLDQVSKSEVFLKAAGGSVLQVGKGVANVVTNPVETAKGLGGGVKRFGMRLGRKSKNVADSATDVVTGEDESAPGSDKSTGGKAADAGVSAANSLAGVTGASRRWAQKLGVDPYSSNAVLRKALEDIGRIDSAGAIAVKIAVPIPPVASLTATTNNLVWGKDPEELAKINAQRATELGVPPKVAERFFKCKAFSPSRQTRLIGALHAVRVKGAEDYVDAASESRSEHEAEFFTESAEMLQRLHAASPVTAVLQDSRAMVAKAQDGRAIAFVPIDWISWTEASNKALVEMDERARKELGASRVELELTGRTSSEARSQFAARGWKVGEDAPSTLPPPIKE
jgi:hypothetical protein